HGIARRGGREIPERGPFGGDDGTLRFVVLRREQPECRVVYLKLAAPFADAAFAQDENLFAVAERVHDDGPFLERDIGAHSHLESISNAFAPGCPPTKMARLDSRKRRLLQPCVRKKAN